MDTLMQKDVLLEGVFQALGYVINKNRNSKDREVLLDLKEKIYCSAPEELDFNEMSQYIKQVIETYKG